MPKLKYYNEITKSWEPVGICAGSNSILVDDTLTKSGYAADAKVVGDILSEKVDADDIQNTIDDALTQAKSSGEFNGDDYILNESDKIEIAEIAASLIDVGSGPAGSVDIKTNETLILENGILSVNTTNNVEQDNTLPITSAGVFATVGNIEALLKTI